MIPCNENTCLKGGELGGGTDTGLDDCVQSSGLPLGCAPGETAHITNYNCYQRLCCYENPPCTCPIECPNGQYLECR